MTLNLKNKVALVTGSTRGIGYAIAERLIGAGASVCVTGRSEKSVNAALARLSPLTLVHGVKVTGKPADVRSEQAVEVLYKFLDCELGGPDILVNNAGLGIFKDLEALAPVEWREVLETNLTGVYLMTHWAIPRMKARGGGSIINISSLAGINAFAGGAVYNASKFGLNGMSEAVMLDHRYDNIKVSTVLPGSVSTEFRHGGAASWKVAPEDIAEIVAAILAMPERTLISHVEVRPSKPSK